MNEQQIQQPSGRARWGWRVLLVLGILLLLNGVALYFISAAPGTFEQDTGVAYIEVAAVFPSVAEQVVREGQTLAVLLAVVGLMAGLASWEGLQTGSRHAWLVTGVLLLMLAYFAVRFLLIDGRADIGGFYLVLAIINLVGQVLSGSQLSS